MPSTTATTAATRHAATRPAKRASRRRVELDRSCTTPGTLPLQPGDRSRRELLRDLARRRDAQYAPGRQRDVEHRLPVGAAVRRALADVDRLPCAHLLLDPVEVERLHRERDERLAVLAAVDAGRPLRRLE